MPQVYDKVSGFLDHLSTPREMSRMKACLFLYLLLLSISFYFANDLSCPTVVLVTQTCD